MMSSPDLTVAQHTPPLSPVKRGGVVLVLSMLVLAACGNEKAAAPEAVAGEKAPEQAAAEPVKASLPNARHLDSGVMVGGQPTDAQLKAAKDEGYKLVVNLRAAGEPGFATEQALVESLGMKYVSIPVDGAGLSEANAKALGDALSANAGSPAIVHCASGNRVGALFALKSFYVDGKGVEEAMAAGREAGLTRMEPAARSHLEAACAASPECSHD